MQAYHLASEPMLTDRQICGQYAVSKMHLKQRSTNKSIKFCVMYKVQLASNAKSL